MIIETVTPSPSPPLKLDKHPLLVDRSQNQHQRRNFHHRAKSDIPKLMLLNESDSFTSSDEEVDDDDDNDDDEDNHSKKNPTTSAFAAAAAVRSRKPRLPPSYHDQHHQHRRHRSFHRRTGSDIILSKAQLDHLLHESPPQDDQNKPHPLQQQKQHQHPLDGQNVLERNRHEYPSSSIPIYSCRGQLLGKPPLMPTSYNHQSSTPPSPTVSYSRTLSHLHATLQMRLHQHGAYHPQVAEIWNKLGNYFFRSRAAEEQQQRAMDCYLEAVRCCKYQDEDALVVNENGKSNSNSDENTNITASSLPATPTLLAVRSASPCSSNYNRESCDCNVEEDKKDDDDNNRHPIDVETGNATNSAPSTTMTTLKAATLQQLAVAYRNMSAVFWATDEINTAISYLHKALDVYESRSSVFNTPKTGDDSSASEPCALSAKMEKQLLLSQVSIASTYYQLGLALTLRKDYDAALDALWQSKSIRERLFHARTFANTSSSTPTDDPEIARIIDAIGKVFYHQGNFDAALQCHRDALQMKRKAAAKATDITARKKMNNLVNGDATEPAISSSTTQSNAPTAPNASTASTTAATTNTSGIMSSLMNIAAVHHARGDLSRAIRIYEKQVLPMQMSALAQGRLQRHHKSWYHVRAAMEVGETLLLLSDLFYDCYFNDEFRNNTNSTNNNIGNMIAATLNSSINSITGTTNNQHLDDKLILAQRMCRETIFVYREAGLNDNHSQMIMALQRLKRFHQLLQRQ